MSTTAADILRKTTRPFAAVYWYLREISGANAFINYQKSYLRRHGTLEGSMGEREFWRELTDEQDRNPQSRCC